jgi:hypothetical protein
MLQQSKPSMKLADEQSNTDTKRGHLATEKKETRREKKK